MSLNGEPDCPDPHAVQHSTAPQHAGGDAALLTRMREGDREAVGQFLTCYGPYIRRRVRGKLKPSMRRLFDSQELLSTLGRRLDRYVCTGRFTAASDPQVWALVFRILDNAMLDKERIMRRLQNVEGEDTVVARTILARIERAEEDPAKGAEVELDELLRMLRTPLERQIVSLWLTGHSLRIIAEYVGLSHDAVRHRWAAIRHNLRQGLEEIV